MVHRLNFGFRLAFTFLFLSQSLQAQDNVQSKTQKKMLRDSEAQNTLGLSAFLDQVRSGNKDYQAAVQGAEGASLRADEASFVTSPQLFGEVLYSQDKKEPDLPSQPKDVRATQLSLGIAQQFSFGLGAKLSYVNAKYDLLGAPALILPPASGHFYRSRPQLELNFPLFKNLLGSETRAQREVLFNQGKAKSYVESFRAKILLAEAESVYWKLALARTLVKSTEENLERAGKMRGWSTRRKNLGLADEAQFLQADANYELRVLEAQSAVDEERVTRRRLNTLRGIDSEQVEYALADPTSEMLDGLKVPGLFSEREDLKAQRAELTAKKAATQISKQKFKPDLNVFGLYAWNGKDAERDKAMSESFKDDKNTYAVGVKFTMPLDVFTLSKQQRGYALEEKATELQLQRKEFESVRDWQDIRERFVEGRNRFKVLLKIEEAQKKKLARERDLQGRGRSTLFQVLQFESENASTQVARTRAQVELLTLYAYLKTYPSSPESTKE